MQGDSEERPIGRPRDARAGRAILQATLELMAERGVHAFRTEDVPAEMGRSNLVIEGDSRACSGHAPRHETFRRSPRSPRVT